MKQSEFKKCVFCGKGMMHNGDIQFFSVQAKSYIINMNAVRSRAGLEMQIGAVLAGVMGPDEDLAAQVVDTGERFICSPCAFTRGLPILEVMEIAADKNEDEKKICSS